MIDRQTQKDINRALMLELGMRTVLYMEYAPRDMRWWRGVVKQALR